MHTDALAQVRFRKTLEGGRRLPVSRGVVNYYACAFVVDGEAFDCRIPLSREGFELGQTYQIPIAFLNLHLVAPKLIEGKAFTLREGKKDVADGKVIELVNK